MQKERVLASAEANIENAVFPVDGNYVYNKLKTTIVEMIEANVEGGTVGIEYEPFQKAFFVTYTYQLPLPVSLNLSKFRYGTFSTQFTIILPENSIVSIVDQVKVILEDIKKIRDWADANQRDQWQALRTEE